MNASEQFFYDHAGYSYDPATETSEQGRERCAKGLASAEEWARRLGLSVKWGPDWGGDHSYTKQPEFDGYNVSTCEIALLCDESGQILGGLGCIDDATPEYRRVVEAELADEYRHEVAQMWANNLKGF